MRAICVAVALLVFAGSASAQNPLVGTWEGTLTSTADGEKHQQPSCRDILGADGYWSSICAAPDRPKPAEGSTRMNDPGTFYARFGTYTVEGNKATLKILVAESPAIEGTVETVTWWLDGDELVVSGSRPGHVARYRRAKRATVTEIAR